MGFDSGKAGSDQQSHQCKLSAKVATGLEDWKATVLEVKLANFKEIEKDEVLVYSAVQ